MWRSSLWSISWLRHQMFYPHVTQRILGYVRPWRIATVHPPKTGRRRKKEHLEELQIGTTFTQRSDVICLLMLLWRMQSLFVLYVTICGNLHTLITHIGQIVISLWCTQVVFCATVQMWQMFHRVSLIWNSCLFLSSLCSCFVVNDSLWFYRWNFRDDSRGS